MKMVVRMAAMLVGAAFVLGAAVAVAHAQQVVQAKVPFEFVAGDAQLPAGGYIITRDVQQPNQIALTTIARGHATFVLTLPSSAPASRSGEPKLEFARVNGKYYLTRIVLEYGAEREILLPEGAKRSETVTVSAY